MVGLGLPMAIAAGTLYALAANAVSYAGYRSKQTGIELTPLKQLALDGGAFCVFLVGGLISTTAYAMGDPVPFLQGALVASNLLWNMLLQICLGICVYTKSMRVGTILCFVAVMFQLDEVGPAPRGDTVNVVEFFKSTSAIIYFVCLGVLIILSGVGIFATSEQPPSSIMKSLMWASHIGALGSGTDNAASTFGLMSGGALYLAFAAYGMLSVYILGLSAKAPAACDASTYVPLQLSMQLVLNTVTGILVWNDLDRMNGKAIEPYIATIVVIILSVYVASPGADIIDTLSRMRVLRITTLSQQVATSTFGRSILMLVDAWKNIQNASGKHSEDAAREALKRSLSIGAEHGRINSQDLVDLAVELYGESGSFAPSATFFTWLDGLPYFSTYLRHDPSFGTQMVELLPNSERMKLPPALAHRLSALYLESTEMATPLSS